MSPAFGISSVRSSCSRSASMNFAMSLWYAPIPALRMWAQRCHKAVLTGGRILRMTIDPHIGGATIVEGGYPKLILPAGYIGSTLVGGCFVLAGWDTLMAKIMSFFLAIGMLMPLRLVRDKMYAPVYLWFAHSHHPGLYCSPSCMKGCSLASGSLTMGTRCAHVLQLLSDMAQVGSAVVLLICRNHEVRCIQSYRAHTDIHLQHLLRNMYAAVTSPQS